MMQTEAAAGYRVVIDSIGKASPVASKVLSEALQLPSEIVFQALYQTPSVMLADIEKETAEKTAELLRQLGLEVSVQDQNEPAPEKAGKVDVAVYIPDAAMLPAVCRSLSEFLGCTQQDALGLLLEEPAVVLGDVSPNTAQALSDRLPAEVMISNPKTASYTLLIQEADKLLLNQLQKYLSQRGIKADLNKEKTIPHLDYTSTQEIWRRFQSTGMVKIINESFERYELLLGAADHSHPRMREKLMEYTGMPDDIVEEVLAQLPIQLEASLNTADVQENIRKYQEAGMTCEVKRVSHKNYRLIIHRMGDIRKAKSILSRMLPEEALPQTTATPWSATVPLNDVMVRYAIAQLEQAGAVAEYEDFD